MKSFAKGGLSGTFFYEAIKYSAERRRCEERCEERERTLNKGAITLEPSQFSALLRSC